MKELCASRKWGKRETILWSWRRQWPCWTAAQSLLDPSLAVESLFHQVVYSGLVSHWLHVECYSNFVQNTGSVNMALLVWISSGLFSLIGAYCFAELGCMIKKSGELKVFSCTVTFLNQEPTTPTSWLLLADFQHSSGTAIFLVWIQPLLYQDVGGVHHHHAGNHCHCCPHLLHLRPQALLPRVQPPRRGCQAARCPLHHHPCLCQLLGCQVGDHDPGTEGTIFPNLTSSQDVFTYAKLFALFVIIVTGVVQLYRGKVKIVEK